MINQLTEEEKWELIGFVRISPHRLLTIQALRNGFLMPSEIARLTGMKTTQASSALIDLKKKNLVVCMNESSHKGRIYQSTELGLAILEVIEHESKRSPWQ